MSDKMMFEFNTAINFVLDGAGEQSLLFLSMWREGNRKGIRNEFPSFNNFVNTAEQDRREKRLSIEKELKALSAHSRIDCKFII